MSDEQVGKYIRLLCLQHQKHQLSKKDMLSICKAYDEDIFSKFTELNGFYYNKRLRDEAIRRANYTQSRRNNAKSNGANKNEREHMHKHMENENENENENEKSIVPKNEIFFKSIPPTFEMVQERIKKRSLKIDAEKFIAYYESNGWKVGKNPMKNWDSCLTTWSKSNYSTNIKNGTTTNGTSGDEQTLRVTKI